MQFYFPIAEMAISSSLLLGLGGLVGFLSGMFGVGGGFLLTPLLLFVGVPPAVAVGTGANQVIAASVSGALAHWRRGNVDLKMGVVLLIGGVGGSALGIVIFSWLRRLGQVDVVIAACYVLFLGVIGALMVVDGARAWRYSRNPVGRRRRLHHHTWVHGLPFKMRFRRSKLYVSALLPLLIGAMVGMLSAIMGVGGGFIVVPAMIYLLGMPTSVVVGTSLFQIIFVTANVTFLQAVNNQTVDVMLALTLLVGSVIGAQFGTAVGARLRGEQLRALLGMIVLLVGVRVGCDLVLTPTELYGLGLVGG